MYLNTILQHQYNAAITSLFFLKKKTNYMYDHVHIILM